VSMTQQTGRVGLAVIGAGYWGPKILRNALQNPAFDVRYLCDVNVDRAAKVLGEYSTVQPVDSLERVLADPAVEAVAIATPAATHADLLSMALEAGKHMLVEKPLADNLEDGIKLVRAADDRGLALMLDHTYCYTPAVTRLRELIRGGEIGTLQYLDSVRINLGLVQNDVNVLWDLASHDLSILDSICPDGNEPIEVAAHGADPLGLGRLSVGYLSVRLGGGGVAHTHVNWLSPTKIRTMIVGGSRRTVVWNDLDPQQRLAVYDRGVDVPRDHGTLQAMYRVGDMVAPALAETEALSLVLDTFARAVIHGERPLTDGCSGLRVLAILEAAEASVRSGGAFVPLELRSEPTYARPQ
jgi:predicted dehydrogenase